MRIAAAVLLALAAECAGAQPRPDACQAQIPRTLARAVAATFPGYRAPLETDNAPEDIRYSQTHGGAGCLGVAIADFDGEGKSDYVLGLTAVKGRGGLAVLAFPGRGGSWRFQKIRSGAEDARFLQYVEVVKPGTYIRAKSRSAPLGPGEKESVDCPHWGALVGTLEAAGVVYCYKDGRWVHVWVSDTGTPAR